MISDVGWLNVISTIGILIVGCSFGLYFMYQARKTKTKLLFYMGLAIFFNGLWYWGNVWESFSLLITGKNFDNTYGITIPYELQAIMSYVWVSISSLFYGYVAASIIIPKIKWYIMGFILFLLIAWELVLFLNPLGSLSIYLPPEPNTDLVDEDLIFGDPLSMLANIWLLFAIFYMGVGYLIKGIKSKDILRKNYVYLSMGNFLSSFFAMLEGFGATGVTLFFTRAGFIVIFWLYYLGLREEQVEDELIPTEKESKIEDSLFRIRKRPARITEEEVTYYKEQKICLVCKGGVGGFNTYICTGCDALYCENCARTLSNAENACWVCNEPIDKSKPSKPFKLTEEFEDLEKLDKKSKK
ncbi:MAG: hypothetical protein ACFE91_12135 [Promethearchaeota archaeon]